jgi:hypothetical protein
VSASIDERSPGVGSASRLLTGTRLRRLRSSHTYGVLVLLVLATYVVMGVAPDTARAEAMIVAMQTGTLAVALWTSGLAGGGRPFAALALIALACVVYGFTGDSTVHGVTGVASAVMVVSSCVVIAVGVVDQGEVNRQSVLGAVCIYLLVGMVFAFVYGAIAVLAAGPLFAEGTDGSPAIRTYFSYVTLTTVGYGDYAVANPLARQLAAFEALAGQIYLVTVVAVLVTNMGRTRDAVRRAATDGPADPQRSDRSR